MNRPYFAYGSNANAEALDEWCRRNGAPVGCVRPIGGAWLADREPAYRYVSRSNGGGALDVKPRRGTATPGVLYEVDLAGWDALDAKEGAALDSPRYRRVSAWALRDDGSELEVVTYEVAPAFRRQGFVAPTDAYRRRVLDGLLAYALPTALHEAAAVGAPVPAMPASLFVYGTLMRGEPRHAMLERGSPSAIEPAEIGGALVDLGEYPALTLGSSHRGVVRGELVRFAALDAIVAELDEEEIFLGFGNSASLYRRAIVCVRTASGFERAWTYVLSRSRDGAPQIASGDWRAR